MKTEKRKAKVGERILITNAHMSIGKYKNGDILTVEKSFQTSGVLGYVFAKGIDVSILDSEYEVIIDENETEADNVVNVNFSEMSLSELEEFVQKAVKALSKRAFHAGFRDGREAQRKLDGKRDERKKSTQQQRDEIIEKAKRDVAELEARLRGDNNRSFGAYVQFFIVSKKRRVIAFIRVKSRFQSVNDKTLSKGIAKCHPDDCFNVHIGKAIALRRALGLEVTDEYLNAPQPTEVRVGDIVKYRNAQRLKTVVTDETPTPLSSDNTRISHARLSVEQFGARIIDDSRDNTEQEVKSE